MVISDRIWLMAWVRALAAERAATALDCDLPSQLEIEVEREYVLPAKHVNADWTHDHWCRTIHAP